MRWRPVRRGGVVAGLVLALTGCGTWGDGSDVVPRPDHPEAWPPTTATECLRARPPVGTPLVWPAALAVRDWRQPVRDGRVEAVFCGRAGSGSEDLLVTVGSTGGVEVAGNAAMAWPRAEDLVTPVTATATGPGTLSVDVADRGGSRHQGMTVWVVRVDDGLVVSECRRPDRCAWD